MLYLSCCINLMVVKPGALQDIAGLFEQCEDKPKYIKIYSNIYKID